MQVSRDIGTRDGVSAVLVARATPLNLELAINMGLAPDEPASPEQLLIAIRADDAEVLAAAEAAVDAALAARERSTGTAAAIPQRTIGAGLDDLPPNTPALAIVSVPGAYAVAEAADAIAAGRSVLVFSDGVPVEQEIALKQAAHEAGVLVMGPDCGTAIVSGVALGFANVVRRGPVGLVAASGTGAQQVLPPRRRRGRRLARARGRRSRPVRGRRRAGHPRRAGRARRRPGDRAGAAGLQAPGAVGRDPGAGSSRPAVRAGPLGG